MDGLHRHDTVNRKPDRGRLRLTRNRRTDERRVIAVGEMPEHKPFERQAGSRTHHRAEFAMTAISGVRRDESGFMDQSIYYLAVVGNVLAGEGIPRVQQGVGSLD